MMNNGRMMTATATEDVATVGATVTIPRIGLDGGNRNIKMAYGFNQGDLRVVPSFYKYLYSATATQGTGNIPPQTFALTYLGGEMSLSQKHIIVGELAREMAGRPVVEGHKPSLMPMLTVAAIASIAEAPTLHIPEVRLCLPSIQDGEATEIRGALKGVHRVENGVGNQSTIKISSVAIELEGVSAYRWLLSRNFFGDLTRTNGIFDVGGGNITGQLFTSSGLPIPESRIVMPGMFSLAQAIAANARELVGIEGKGVNPKSETILDAIADGGFIYGATGVSFKGTYDIIFPDWLDEFRNRLRTKWQDYLPQVAEVGIVGGAAPLMGPLVEKTNKRFRIANDPATCTVLGMLL
jgi:hypothetical protein